MPGMLFAVTTWDDRLSWAFGLIDGDPQLRARACQRLELARRQRSEALTAFNHVWMVQEHSHWTPAVALANEKYLSARAEILPDALWGNVSGGGLRYVLLYLEWEARYPDEWMAHGKSWGTKQRQLRELTGSAGTLPEWAQDKLIELLGLVVPRAQRLGDGEYARLARVLPPARVRAELAPMAESDDFTVRSRAGYLLWLLDDPELPHPKTAQWQRWAARAGLPSPHSG
jgi:hypothetical protein